jgi:hypothetical protein
MHSYGIGEVLRLELDERHHLVGLETWGVVSGIWQHTNAASPSDERGEFMRPAQRRLAHRTVRGSQRRTR